MKRLYIIRKFVKAATAQEAIEKEKDQMPDDVFLEDEWVKNNITQHESPKRNKIGY